MGLELQCVWMKRLVRIYLSHYNLYAEGHPTAESWKPVALSNSVEFSLPQPKPLLLLSGDTILPTMETRERASAMSDYNWEDAHACGRMRPTHPPPIKLSLLMRWLINKDHMEKVVRLKFPRKMSHVVQFFQENVSLARTARILTSHLTEGKLASVHKCIFQKKTESSGFIIRVLSLWQRHFAFKTQSSNPDIIPEDYSLALPWKDEASI